MLSCILLLITNILKMTKIILASSSTTRYKLLKRIFNTFDCINPSIDETQLSGEEPESLSLRLSKQKSLKIAKNQPNSIVIGSDQVAVCNGKILGKPNTIENAIKQIEWQIGKKTEFFTGLALSRRLGDEIQFSVTKSYVIYHDNKFITHDLIKNYVKKDQPLNCAGGAKFESLGISLIKEFSSRDPTAILGLPLIDLCNKLSKWNIHPLKEI